MIKYSKFCALADSLIAQGFIYNRHISADSRHLYITAFLDKDISVSHSYCIYTPRHLPSCRIEDKLLKHNGIFNHWLDAYNLGIK